MRRFRQATSLKWSRLGLISWVHEPRIAGGQEMTYGRSLERHLKYFGLVDDGGKAITFSEWAALAQDRAGWLKLVTKAPFTRGEAELPGAACPRD